MNLESRDSMVCDRDLREDPLAISNRVRHLDGIRGVGIIGVLCVHWLAPYLPAFRGGYVGVDVFFVLSGYVITSILIKTERNYSTFIWGRVRRLYPPLLGLLIGGSHSRLCCQGTTYGWQPGGR